MMRPLRLLLVAILLPLGLGGCVVAPGPGYYAPGPYAYRAPPPAYYYGPPPRPYYGYRRW